MSSLQEELDGLRDILRKNYKGHMKRSTSPPILVDEQTYPPPFEATLVYSHPNFPLDIYLGSVSDAMHPNNLLLKNILGIANVAFAQCRDVQRMQHLWGDVGVVSESSIPNQWEIVEFSQQWYAKNLNNAKFKYLCVAAEDHIKYPIRRDFEAFFDFIDEIERGVDVTGSSSIKSKPAVLIHCMQGLNRSAAVVAAWMVKRAIEQRGYSSHPVLPEVIDDLSTKRGKKILSNLNFLKDLILFERDLRKGMDQLVNPVPTKTFSIGNIIDRTVAVNTDKKSSSIIELN